MNVNDKLKIIKLHINIINILLKVLNEFKALLLIRDKYSWSPFYGGNEGNTRKCCSVNICDLQEAELLSKGL